MNCEFENDDFFSIYEQVKIVTKNMNYSINRMALYEKKKNVSKMEKVYKKKMYIIIFFIY